MGLLQHLLYYWNREIDPRVADLPLISSPYKMAIIIFVYLYVVLDFGPKFMKRRPPYSFTTFIKLYNIVQIMANSWLIYDIIDAGLFSSINLFTCPLFEHTNSNDYTSRRVSRCLWYYFLLKIIDLIETVLFALRKKDNQISTLHLYHHVSTLLIVWILIRSYIASALIFLLILNCFVHAIMYIYYFLAACGPDVQKIIAPMKQYLTTIQIIQLIMLLLYPLQSMLSSCKIENKGYYIIMIIDMIINLYFFYHFYKRTYMKSKKSIKKQ